MSIDYARAVKTSPLAGSFYIATTTDCLNFRCSSTQHSTLAEALFSQPVPPSSRSSVWTGCS